jgi:tRNA 2-selenouridine synthase
VLRKIATAGGQVVDLECMARHRGSVFGRHATSAQPSQRFFESSLALALSSLDPTRPLIIEAESPRIGSLHLPSELKSAMRSGCPRSSHEAPNPSSSHSCRSAAYRNFGPFDFPRKLAR